MTRRAATIMTVLAATALIAAPAAIDHPPALVWNASASVPIGLYRVQPLVKLHITELVVAAPPEPLVSMLADGGYLPRGVPLLKRVLALPGQTVCRAGRAITVDNIDMGEARERDGRGRLLPVWDGCRLIAEGEVFLMNWQSADSLDGRYFGPLPVASIVGRATPLWTFEEP
jgi:conjugative transfer signal peptidase TraF